MTCGVGPSIFTAKGHYIVLVAVDSGGNVSVNDPGKKKYDSILKKKQLKLAGKPDPFTSAECPGGTERRANYLQLRDSAKGTMDWYDIWLCKSETLSTPILSNQSSGENRFIPGRYVWPAIKSATVLLPKGQAL